MKSRTKKPAGSKAPKPESQETSTDARQSLEPSVEDPPRLFILPKALSADSRIVSLPCPATNSLSRYLICPDKGFFEFTRIAPPKKACRSWLLAPEVTTENGAQSCWNDAVDTPAKDQEGYVLQQPEIFVATPLDPIFVALPVLLPEQVAEHGANRDLQSFIMKNAKLLSVEDYVEKLYARAPVLRDIDGIEAQLSSRFDAICDTVEVGEERMYRLNTEKLYAELIRKARLMVANGLPASMEERFIKQMLAVPELGLKREESTVSIAADNNAEGDIYDASSTKNESQDSGYETQDISTSASSKSSSTTASEDITDLLRIRIAMDFMENSYLSPSLKSEMIRLGAQTQLRYSPGTPEMEIIDFQPLNNHIAMLNEKKKQAQALRSLSDNISRKRALADDDEEAIEKIEAKKRKKEEEEAKKKNITRGLKQLEKVDRSGMKKLSSFFSKAPTKK